MRYTAQQSDKKDNLEQSPDGRCPRQHKDRAPRSAASEKRPGYLRLLLALLTPLLAAPFCAGATQNNRESYIFSEIDHHQSLSHSSVICIYKDDSELMWFGTYDGVNCFDGKEMDVFRTNPLQTPTLDNNVIFGIDKADANNLWISTQVGINRFSREKRRIVANYNLDPNAHLCSNSKGNTWVIGRDSVVYYNPQLDRFIGIEGFNKTTNDPGMRTFVTGDGELWLFPDSVRAGELYKISLSAFDGQTPAEVSIASGHFHSKHVEKLFHQDDRSFCFVDADQDLYMYDVVQKTKVYIRNIASLLQKYGPIVGMVPFYDDLMIAFRTNGLVRLKATESYREEMIDRNLRIFSLYKDSAQGILWIGVDGRGAMMYTKRNSIATNLMTQQLSPNFTRQVRSIMTDKYGGLWYGTKGDGLVHIRDYAAGANPDKATVYFQQKRQPARTYTREDTEFPVYSLTQSRYMDGFWIGSGPAGMFYHLFGEQQIRPLNAIKDRLPEEIHSIHEANDTTLYIATSNGFHRLTLDRAGDRIQVKDRKQYRFFYEQQEISIFYSLLPQGDSILWLGSRERGLVRFETATESYWVHSLKEMMNRPVDDILCLQWAKNGNLLIGTTAGLVRLQFNGKRMQARYTGREQGLLNDMIHGIHEDANASLWLSTNKGLVKYNPTDGSSHSYYYTGGVQIGEFSDDAYYECPYSGRLFFGGMDGLLYFDRIGSDDHGYYPEILLRRLSFGQKQAHLADYYTLDRSALRFKYANQDFSLSFAVPDYISGADIEYSWMLDGHDTEWSPFTPHNQASFANIPPGDYTFKVLYRKDLFDTGGKSLAIPIQILPLWHQTALARILLAVIAIVGIFYLVHVLRRSIRNKHTLNELQRIESGNAAKTNTSYRNREIIAGLSSIYQACSGLNAENTGSKSWGGEVADSIRETVISLLLPADLLRESGIQDAPPLARFTHVSTMRVKEISDEVLYSLLKRGVDLSNVEVNIPDTFSIPVYKNAFRIFFNYVYLFVCGSKRFSISASESEGRIDLTFRSSKSILKSLHESLTDQNYSLLPVSKDPDTLFAMQQLHSFVCSIIKQLDPIIAYSESDSELSLSFAPAELPADSGTNKKIILLLEDRDEMYWCVNSILSDEYIVQQVRSIQQAVEAMESSQPVVFLVDMMMYTDAEETFMEFVTHNGSLLSKRGFVLLTSWKMSASMHHTLLQYADALVTLPYDLVFLREIVRKAIYGRAEAKQVRVNGLSQSIANLFTCTTAEQADFVRRMVTVIQEYIDQENLGSAFIAERLAMSSRQFYRKFKDISTYSPAEFIKNYRLEKAAALLLENMSIKDVMAEIGISSRSYFYREFTGKYGMTPSDYRAQSATKPSRETP